MNTLTSKEGSIVPSVVFKLRENDSWTSRSTDEIFGNRTVVVFSLPGAFTPTCSSTHVPRFNELAGTFKENGVDEIICMSVNDPFVMDAWAKDQQAEHISFIADGNGAFTQQMGLKQYLKNLFKSIHFMLKHLCIRHRNASIKYGHYISERYYEHNVLVSRRGIEACGEIMRSL